MAVLLIAVLSPKTNTPHLFLFSSLFLCIFTFEALAITGKSQRDAENNRLGQEQPGSLSLTWLSGLLPE